MMTIQEIQTLSKRYKNILPKYFYNEHSPSVKPLKKFKKHEINAFYLLSIEKPLELSQFFNTTFFKLENIINSPSYQNYTIKKKRGGLRQIFAPDKRLKSIQKRLNYFLQAYYLLIKPNEVHGFVVNPHYLGTYCNIVENAKIHVNKKYVLNIDLKDFFPSISAQQVKEVFSSSYFNFNDQIATALTLLSTYQGQLPIGAPTSPVISNFICLPLDDSLKNYCQKNNLVFSRYADDITFSSDSKISDETILEISNLINKHNFEINKKKVHLKTANKKQTVTGLTVNKKVNVDRKLLKKIRAMLHDLSTNGIEPAAKKHFKTEAIDKKQTSTFINRLEGYINFVGQVRGKNDAIFLKFKSEFEKVLKKRTLIKKS